jgi:hypothetical protein
MKFNDEYGKWQIEYKITQSVLTFIELIYHVGEIP